MSASQYERCPDALDYYHCPHGETEVEPITPGTVPASSPNGTGKHPATGFDPLNMVLLALALLLAAIGFFIMRRRAASI